MKKEGITMKDIAREANVSVATVSHVINNTKNISQATRKKVMSITEKYNYTPNYSAKNLRQQSTKTVALVISSHPDAFVTEMIFAIEERAAEMDYNLLLVNTKEHSEYEEKTINLLHSNLVDGIILSPTSGDIQYLQNYTKDKFPIVMVNRYDDSIESISRVTGDNFQLGYDATMHLLDHGHEKIGFIYTYPDVSTTEDRIKGHHEALKQANIPFDQELIIQGFAHIDGGAAATKELLMKNNRITALFIQNDLMTIGALDAIKEMYLRIPDDIAIIGFGEFSASHIIDPSITTIVLPPETIGKTAFDILLNKMNNPDYMNHVELPPFMNIRKSCGCQ
ncbi:LacI family DNA-binding transcriptional regulator [Oceanobacillus jeddahense]|uniref:LacI family DNA-binding transcriptional regulator n=1 Tax=Oceanobacillus jeddahense TaxID=1462527 RepID=UPI000595C25C|nr:LacI family DNA-binding transcriptional regulator [Oceanobacillus jeddahense]